MTYFLDPSYAGFLTSKSVLFRFWKRAGGVPLYVWQTTSELTGEHTCVMVRGLNTFVESGYASWREPRGVFVHLYYSSFCLTYGLDFYSMLPPLSFGIETRGVMTALIKHKLPNTTVLTKKSEVFSTYSESPTTNPVCLFRFTKECVLAPRITIF